VASSQQVLAHLLIFTMRCWWWAVWPLVFRRGGGVVDDGGMVGLPGGTVTLLFSDIEGSTALLSRLGPAYADALDGQRAVLREAWGLHNGTEMGTEGDSFYVVFASAGDAVAAAVRAQRELAGFAWPGGEQVRVRVGMHTGSPQVHDGGYVGMDVHRAARIAGSAHGGQVVLSAATAALVGGALPAGVSLLDLGWHLFKDIAGAERVFQLVIEGLPAEFAALKSLGAASSLPVPATGLVGRDGELAELVALLGSPGVRLVSLTGPGGSGKTRLAVGVAQRLVAAFPDGVYFVALAAVGSPDVMWTSIAEALDVPPEGRAPPRLFSYLAHRGALLVLDNLEQLPGADGVVAQLLAQAPKMVVIATTRRALGVAGERQHPVPPLELPAESTRESALASGAVQLFIQHAQMVRPGFVFTAENAADVTGICRGLDGLPLAIELAAARTRLLSPRALLARLDQALELKDTGVDRPSRQQTLRQTIAWSHDLLDPAHQLVFRRLGVFAGGADLDAIAAVTADCPQTADLLDVVAELADSSLVVIGEGADGEPRVGMLETVRAYARDRLRAAGELDPVQRLHAEHFAGLIAGAETGLWDEYDRWMALLDAEIDNIRTALGWLHSTGDPELGARMLADLGSYWGYSGALAEGSRWLTQAAADTPPDSTIRAALTALLASLEIRQGNLTDHVVGLPEAVRQLSVAGETVEYTAGLGSLSDALWLQGRWEEAIAAAASAAETARTLGVPTLLAHALGMLGVSLAEHDEPERGLDLMTEAAALIPPGTAHFHRLGLLINLSWTEIQNRRYEQARDHLLPGLKPGDIDTRNLYEQALIRMNLGWAMLGTGETRAALGHFQQSITLADRIGNNAWVAEALAGLGCAAADLHAPTIPGLAFGLAAHLLEQTASELSPYVTQRQTQASAQLDPAQLEQDLLAGRGFTPSGLVSLTESITG